MDVAEPAPGGNSEVIGGPTVLTGFFGSEKSSFSVSLPFQM